MSRAWFRRAGILLLLPVLLIGGAVYATASIQRNAALLAAHRQEASQRLLTAMLDQETGARGYFQTERPLFLEPWNNGTKAFEASVTELRSLVRGSHTLNQMLADQVQRGTRWHTAAATQIEILQRTGDAPSPDDALADKSVMDGFRAANAQFDQELQHQRDHSLTAATVVAVAIAAALAAILVAIGLLVSRLVSLANAARMRDQAQLRELLQASESEEESRALLIRHLERLHRGVRAAVFNRNNSDDRLEITRGGGPADRLLADVDTDQLRPRSCMAVRLSRSYEHDPRNESLLTCELCGELPGASMCEPLLVSGQVIGSVLIVSGKPISDGRRDRLRESVTQVAPILANQRNLALAETRAASDALTGLPNRRMADETLKRMAAHAGRSVSPMAAILLDLDHFKTVNDRHGHASGDRALSLVGRVISSTIRTSDFAARFGGEEFLILLPDTDQSGAVKLAEKLRTEINNAQLVGMPPVSASLGVAMLPNDAVEPDDLLRKADRALYTAKQDGRNRTHVFAAVTADEDSLEAS